MSLSATEQERKGTLPTPNACHCWLRPPPATTMTTTPQMPQCPNAPRGDGWGNPMAWIVLSTHKCRYVRGEDRGDPRRSRGPLGLRTVPQQVPLTMGRGHCLWEGRHEQTPD